MGRILAGTETEYGLCVEGRGAESQIEDSMALVRGYSGGSFSGWDYRHESPRADLRGFSLERLAVDPEDSKFDRVSDTPIDDVRSDRILANGARFYNDHGHPEYATPECWSLEEIALHDRAGQSVVLQAAHEFERASGRKVSIYKNNVDYHGASYGAHESFLVPRALGFDAVFRAVMPMLVVRQALCGAGRVGAERDRSVTFQLSQRADFMVEATSAETLFRRPVFNTRDEPHADPRRFLRLHVISGDANMMPGCTARKIGLVKIALHLAEIGDAPRWDISDPAASMRALSHAPSLNCRIDLSGKSWTTPFAILESYLDAADRHTLLHDLVEECRILMEAFCERRDEFARQVDWAAKLRVLERFRESEGLAWTDPVMQSLDLEYHNVDPEEGLYFALLESGDIAPESPVSEIEKRLQRPTERNRAYARSVALERLGGEIKTMSWSSITFNTPSGDLEVYLDPELECGPELDSVGTVLEYMENVAS